MPWARAIRSFGHRQRRPEDWIVATSRQQDGTRSGSQAVSVCIVLIAVTHQVVQREAVVAGDEGDAPFGAFAGSGIDVGIPQMRLANKSSIASSPRQKRRTSSRYPSFHSAPARTSAPSAISDRYSCNSRGGVFIIVARGFECIPTELLRRSAEGSHAAYSLSLDVSRGPLPESCSGGVRQAVVRRTSSPAAEVRHRRFCPHTAQLAPLSSRDRSGAIQLQTSTVPHRFPPAPRRSATNPILDPPPVANRPIACLWRLCPPRVHGRRRRPAGSVARCTRGPCGWRRSAASTAPCFPASV